MYSHSFLVTSVRSISVTAAVPVPSDAEAAPTTRASGSLRRTGLPNASEDGEDEDEDEDEYGDKEGKGEVTAGRREGDRCKAAAVFKMALNIMTSEKR